jgi:hypothetical protein
LAESGQKALAQRRLARAREDAAENDLMLAVKLWKARQELCPAQPPANDAIARVLTQLARE